MSNTDLFDPSDVPVARGRRDPELQSRLEAEDMMPDPGDPDQSWASLAPGDSVIAKVSISAPTALGEAWFTYGATTHLFDGESEDEAFSRLSDVVNTRVIDLASEATGRVNDLVAERRAAERTHRITPR